MLEFKVEKWVKTENRIHFKAVSGSVELFHFQYTLLSYK